MLKLTDTEEAFKREVRDFFATTYPRRIIDKVRHGYRLDRADHVEAQQALNARGWLGVGWPKANGGTGWNPVERYIFDLELERASAAPIVPMGIIYIGPILCAFGSEQQKAEWLPDILESRSFWAQGYSEPEAGSDLASLRFSAVRDGDDYILNGTKIWTSYAQWSDWIFCLARTSREERKQQGLSLICSPLDLPGITIHPIRLLDGSFELNRVEFDNVRVPVSHRIGAEGAAWDYANVLLKNERLSYAHIGAKKRDLARIRTIAAEMPGPRGRPMSDAPAFRTSAARIEARLAAIEASILHALRTDISMATAAALKIACTECAQALTELRILVAGRNRGPMLDRSQGDWQTLAPATPAFASVAIQDHLFERAQTIYGGSSEVQKNIIWRSLSAGGRR